MTKSVKHIVGLALLVSLCVLNFGCKKFLDRKPLTSTLDDLNQGGLKPRPWACTAQSGILDLILI